MYECNKTYLGIEFKLCVNMAGTVQVFHFFYAQENEEKQDSNESQATKQSTKMADDDGGVTYGCSC